MTVYRLGPDLVFPPPSEAEPNGLLAVDGDLSPERLLLAYSSGIFPWFTDGERIFWFSPDPRMVLLPTELRIPRGVRRTLRDHSFRLTLDCAFEQVIGRCAEAPREEDSGTWISDMIRRAYCQLHELGFAHSVEVWLDEELVGGLYGVALGRVFSAESMFHRASGAGWASLIGLVRQLEDWDFAMLDCQIWSDHTQRLGAVEWDRADYLSELAEAVARPTRRGRWSFDRDPVL